MSFLSTLGQYVADMADSVAGLALSPRRGPPARHKSADDVPQPPAHATTMRGFPRVVPTEGVVASPAANSTALSGLAAQGRRRTLECLAPGQMPSRSRGGSLRVSRGSTPSPTPPQPEKPTLVFCRRRLSWPEIDNNVNSGVQETDGSYFENFTALSWRQENRRLSALRGAEARAEREPPPSAEVGLPASPAALPHKEHEHLYTEVLYTIANAVGAPAPGGQYAHYKDEIYEVARRAFKVPTDRHYRLLHAAGSERPPTVVLAVHVMEADGLEAKDANGFSDPYCMLGIQPASLPASPRATEPSGASAGDDERRSKHGGFRLSFKRRDGRQQRDSLGRLPARYIRATNVVPHTLSPKWDETFKFYFGSSDIDDVQSDVLHLDIWDHDDESSVLDAVSRLNEVRGVRGLGRFFKQVCQSARQGSQDDFLGCVNIPIREIPSTGLEGWFRLEARSQRSSVQGRIRLRLWLSAREAGHRTGDEDDNWQQVRQHDRLFGVLLAHEAFAEGGDGSGNLPGPALTLLHQHAVQGDLTPLQACLARWAAAVRLTRDTPLDPRYMHKLLTEVEKVWTSSTSSSTATREEERWLAETFCSFIDHSLQQIRLHRDLFPVLHQPSLTRLEYLLRCLNLLSQMKAFWKCCPFNKEIRGEIIVHLRKGTAEWYETLTNQDTMSEMGEHLINMATIIQIDLQQGLTYYHPLFETTNNVAYFTVVFMQFDKMLSEDVRMCVEQWTTEGWCGVADFEGENDNYIPCIEYNNSPQHRKSIERFNSEATNDEYNPGATAKTLPFELLVAIRELTALAQIQNIGTVPSGGEGKPQPVLIHANSWFDPLIDRWLAVTKSMALQRVRAAVELDRVVEGEKIVKHSTSSVDTAAILYQMRATWRLVGGGGSGGVSKLVEAACGAALHYADLVHRSLADAGYYENTGSIENMCVAANNLEYVRRSLSEYEDEISEGGSAGGGGGAGAAGALLRGALSQLESRASRALSAAAPRARPALRKAVFHLAWSPDTLPTPQAITPLLEYLDQFLVSLNTMLLSRNFERALSACWGGVLRELASHADAAGADRPRCFHDRLRDALDYLVDFFHAEGKGLSIAELHSEAYCRVEQRLQYHRAPTEQLLDLWLAQRLQDQTNAPAPGPYGTISVRAYFNHDSLCIEVLSARYVIPLDPNGFSDPFVIVELLPKRVFPNCNEQQTAVQKKTLHPVWDECFEYGVTLDQCRSAYASISLTVMDKDVLTADDFAGEAFVALARIPGVIGAPGTSLVNMNSIGLASGPLTATDPLRTLELPLMQLHDKQHPILQILESRTNDKVAMDFVKKQKMRFSS